MLLTEAPLLDLATLMLSKLFCFLTRNASQKRYPASQRIYLKRLHIPRDLDIQHGSSCAAFPNLQTRKSHDILHSFETEAELMIRTCAEIVSELLKAHEEGSDVSLNAVRSKVAKRNKLKTMPRLVDIISAVPEGVKELLLPKLKAKPVRTASGVSEVEKILA